MYGKEFEYIQIRYSDYPKVLDEDIIVKKPSFIVKMKRLVHAYTSVRFGKLVHYVHNNHDLSHIDLVISPVITLLPFHMGMPYIVTIHDFQHKYYPDFFTLKEKLIREVIYRTGKFASLIVVESNHVKKDVVKYLEIDEEKIRVLQSPPPSYLFKTKIDNRKLKEVKEKYNLPNKYIFYPAQFWHHKNHIKLLEAIYLIYKKYKIRMPLVLVGSRKSNFENVIKKVKELGMNDSVIYLGYVPDEYMPYLYKLSTALIMPTLFESVSIPIWEAFYLGVPVVSSNVCALPEQVKDAGLLFNPNNVEDMAEKIYKIWVDEDLRKKLVEKGYERVKNLTLEKYAKQWENIIKEVLKLKAQRQ